MFCAFRAFTSLTTPIVTLMLRLYALYQLNKAVLATMITVFITSLGAAGAILVLNLANIGGAGASACSKSACGDADAVPRSAVNAHVIPGMPFCVPIGLSTHFWTYWIPVLTCESFLCGLALYRAFSGGLAEPTSDARDTRQAHRRGRGAWHGEGGTFVRRLAGIFQNGQRIVDVLIRDSILFFLV